MPRLKKIGIGVLILFLLFLLTLAALPLWLPWALNPVLTRMGVEYESYERAGYGRFVLGDVAYQRDEVQVEAERVEGYLPAGWLWSRWRGVEEVDYLGVDNWRVEIKTLEDRDDLPDEEAPDEEISVYEIFEDVEGILAHVISWLPRASLGSGELVVPDRVIDIRGATWRKGLVAAEVFDRALEQVVTFEGDVGRGLPYRFRGEVKPFPFEIEVTLSRVEERVEVRSEARLAGNRLVADADFPRRGYLPEQANFRADDFVLPPEYLEVDGYEDIRGALRLGWQEGRFTADLSGGAIPEDDWKGRLPPLEVKSSVRGGLESFEVDVLEIHTPWLVASLSNPVGMDYTGELLTEASLFGLAADLAEQPFVDIEGMLRGEVRISPGEERLPLVDFNLVGDDLAGFGVDLERAELTGSLRWPELAVAAVTVEGRDDSRAAGSAVLDLETMEVMGGQFEASVFPELVAHWIPEAIQFSQVSASGTFEGSVESLRHEGRVEFADFLAPSTHPMDGELVWQGQMADLSDLNLDVVAGAGRLAIDGATELGEESVELLLRDVRLERDGEPLLESVVESRVLAGWADNAVSASLDQMHWSGDGREVKAAAALEWPGRGEFAANLRGLKADLVSDFVDVEADFVTLAVADLEGSWADGPMDWRALADIRVEVDEEKISLTTQIHGDREELRIEEFLATSGGETVVTAEGKLPLALWPGQEEILRIHEEGEIEFRARTDPQAAFWEQMGDLVGVQLDDPQLSLEVTGTPAAPSGHLAASAPMINLRALENGDQAIPVLSDLKIDTRFDVDEVRLRELSLNVERQRLEAEGTLPMGSDEWGALIREGTLPDWEKATGRFAIPEARLSAFTRFAPTILSPQGVLKADVEILPGGRFDGLITVENAATRPLMPLGALRQGTARVVLRDRTAHIEEVSVLVGGERLAVQGEVDIPLEQPLAFDVGVRGKNLPLARQPGVVIRGDLDLALRSQEGAQPVISGRVDLRDSFYLAHLRLMPGGAVATPTQRPPFFSVEQEPVSDWRLNVDVRGPGFLNVRGPIFQGVISASFNLSGTLEEPRAIGAATIDTGRVRFPFATMHIEQGEVALRREDPFQPQLFIVATGATFGYDVTMEVTGTAETPAIEFMSNPPLTTEQALLMVTTGEVPRDEIRFTTQQRATRFAIFFGQNLLYELTGDDAAGDRLVIRSGEQVSEGGRETVAIEYKLTRRWSLTGEYDRFDEYNAGVKWNIFSR